jgi:hypothetical protein
MREYSQKKSRRDRRTPAAAQRRSRRFQQMSVRHAGRTCRLARPASKAPVDVLTQIRVVRRQNSISKRAHEYEATAG